MMPDLGYDPKSLPRELKRHYISASDSDIQEMLKAVNAKSLEDLYSHIPDQIKFGDSFHVPEELSYDDLQKHLYELSEKNIKISSFIGDGLQSFKVSPVVKDVLKIRGLTTAYTPYQPERSQGTLLTHWIYSSLLSQITGFEAINASMYDRSTALLEALNCAQRIKKNANTALVLGSIYPGDIEVLKTHTKGTSLSVEFVSLNPKTGKTAVEEVKKRAVELGSDLACIAYPQINHFGNLEDVDAFTDLAHELNTIAIAIIDPILLATGALKPPSKYGNKGADIFVGEGQHLALPPIFGGPGLGVFGIRYNETCKNNIRSTAGRFIGAGFDQFGVPAKLLVLSTREQHIRREKATSNICSNQAFVATLAGAALLSKGESGFKDSCAQARKNALDAFNKLTSIDGVEAAFPNSPFYNEFTLKLPMSSKELIDKSLKDGVLVGSDVSARISNGGNLLLVSFSDLQGEEDIEKLTSTVSKIIGKGLKASAIAPEIPSNLIRSGEIGLLKVDDSEIVKYYNKLGSTNASPDVSCYPLGSCTMKYNPYINDYAAGLDGFCLNHPQAPESISQGSLEILYNIQEWFIGITGLAGVTTQPLAGAQGELTGLKLFQAYHWDRKDFDRNIVLIASSAHGTNPATVTMAGMETKVVNGVPTGVVTVKGDSTGRVDIEHLKELLAKYGKHVCGVMVTNPNTSGIMESSFRIMSELVHEAGGLVYMDGANMNAIAGWLDLSKMGVDAVHQNLHKTWSIPHGGGGPGDGVVGVSEKLLDFLPGLNVKKSTNGTFSFYKSSKSIGSIHRHYGNFGHKVRCYTYLARLGKEGIKRMSAVAVLSARYLHKRITEKFPTLPKGAENSPRMHEFIITLPDALFSKIEKAGIPKANIISRIGKLFLDFGFHAPTVAFPEVYGLMIEPTETYSKAELDRFADTVLAIYDLIDAHPEVLKTVPHFTPISRIDDVTANKNLVLSEVISKLPETQEDKFPNHELRVMPIAEITELILKKHAELSK